MNSKEPEMILDDWQKEIIEDISQYILLCKGRQSGGTSTFAKKAAKWMMEKKSRILVGSITEEQAKLVIVMVNDILRKEYPDQIAKGKKKPTLERIRLKNGAEIRSRPVGIMGDAFRGFTADVNWFNEASKWPEIAFVAIMPTLLTTGGEIWMDSTPFGEDTADRPNFFARCYKNKDKRWKIYYKTSEDVILNRPINDYWTENRRAAAIKFLSDQKAELSEIQYGQEYLAMFMEELKIFFTEEWITKVCRAKLPSPEEAKEILESGDRYAGHDLARMGGDSFTAEIMWKQRNGKVRHIDHYSEKKLLTTRNEDLIKLYSNKWNCRQSGIDAGAGSLGVSILDHLINDPEFRNKIVAMNNRSVVTDRDGKTQRLFKEDLYDNLRAMGDHDEIELLDIEAVKHSLRSVQIEITKDLHELPKVRIYGEDAHIVEGITRAAQLAKEKSSNIRILSI